MTAVALALVFAVAQAEAPRYVEMGRRALDENRLVQAEDFFRRATQSDRSSAEAYYFLGLTLVRKGDAKAAVASLERARDLSPEPSASVLFELGTAYAGASRLAEAEKALIQAAALAPERDRIHLELGWVYYKKLEGEKAEVEFRKALERKASGTAYFYLGLAETALGKLPGAVDSFKKSVLLEPERIDAYVALGKNLVRLAREVEAEDVLKRAILRDPGAAEAHYQLGLLALGRGELDAAAERFERAVSADAGHQAASYNLLLVYERLGRVDKAADARRRFQELAAKPK